MRAIGVKLVSQGELLEEALLFSASAGLAVYDALFCVLAQREDAPLITADGPLINRIAGTGIRTLTLAEWAAPV